MTTVPTNYDVIVIGLGGMGSSAAYHIAARGQRVLGLDRHQRAHDKGSSHGGSRIIRQAYFEDPAYVPLLLRAYELWEKLAHDTSWEVYRLTGGLFIGPPDCPLVAGSLCSSIQWALPHEVLDANEITSRFPNFTPNPADVAVYEAKAGFARPEMTVRAHLGLAEKAGAALQFSEPVLAWSATDAGVRVTTTHDTYTAGQLVICPGAWAPQVLSGLGASIIVERQVTYWLEPVGTGAAFEDHPLFINENTSGTRIYGLPAIDGPTGGVKVGFHCRSSTCTPDTIDRVVYPEEIRAMQQRVGELLPTLTGPCLRATTCMYSMTPDEHFVIARHPQHANVSAACGFSGHGFKFVPVVGEILADLTIDGFTRHPISLFDPCRFARQTTAEPASEDGRR